MNPSAINILIADDDKEDAKTLFEALQDILPSSECFFARDGLEVLEVIRNYEHPDLVFLDLNMPLKNGVKCLKEIYNDKLLPNTPIVIYSTSKNEVDIDECYKYGAQFYIIKPAVFSELKKVIRLAISILGRPINERVDKANFVLREGRMV
jgi:CheY-like chemotaxis protein